MFGKVLLGEGRRRGCGVGLVGTLIRLGFEGRVALLVVAALLGLGASWALGRVPARSGVSDIVSQSWLNYW